MKQFAVVVLSASRFLHLGIHSNTIAAEIIFDSFTPPDHGGFSSGDQGITTQVRVSEDIAISGLSILNCTRESTQIKFAIYDHASHELLYASDAIEFDSDEGDTPSWKSSTTFDLTLEGGKDYDVGYAHDVPVFDVTDYVAESMNGISSGISVGVIRDFQSLEFSHHFNAFADAGIRLHGIPEPSMQPCFFLPVLVLACRKQGREVVEYSAFCLPHRT